MGNILKLKTTLILRLRLLDWEGCFPYFWVFSLQVVQENFPGMAHWRNIGSHACPVGDNFTPFHIFFPWLFPEISYPLTYCCTIDVGNWRGSGGPASHTRISSVQRTRLTANTQTDIGIFWCFVRCVCLKPIQTNRQTCPYGTCTSVRGADHYFFSAEDPTDR